jgi:hypothetical protein
MIAFASRFPYGIAHNTNQRFVIDLNNHFKNSVLPTLKKPPVNLKVKKHKLRINRIVV